MNVAPVKVKTVTDKQKAPWKPAVKLLGVQKDLNDANTNFKNPPSNPYAILM